MDLVRCKDPSRPEINRTWAQRHSPAPHQDGDRSNFVVHVRCTTTKNARFEQHADARAQKRERHVSAVLSDHDALHLSTQYNFWENQMKCHRGYDCHARDSPQVLPRHRTHPTTVGGTPSAPINTNITCRPSRRCHRYPSGHHHHRRSLAKEHWWIRHESGPP